MRGIAIIFGVMLFLWSTAVVATGVGMYITDGRLSRSEWRKVISALIALLGLAIAYFAADDWAEAPRPQPIDEAAPVIP